MNLLLLASTLCAFNSVSVEGGILCYKMEDSAFYAPYEGLKPDFKMVFFAGSTVKEALETEWINDFEMITKHYSPETGCRTWFGENELEATQCELE